MTTPPVFSVDVRTEGDDAVVAVAGEIDLATAPMFWTRIQQAMADRPPRLVIDLAETTFMDSTGLAVIIRASSMYGADTVCVRSAGRRVRSLFELTGLGRYIVVLPEDDEAADEIAPAAPDPPVA